MAINLFCGRPGSGKSYGVIENVILPAIQKGRVIYTNIPLNIDVINQDYPHSDKIIHQFANDQVNGDFLMSIPGGAVIVIDECWRYWPAGQKSSTMPQKDKEFFAEHRHKAGEDQLTQEIVLVTQSPSQIAKYVKDLIDQTVFTIKADKVGLSKKFKVLIFPGCIPSLERPGEPNNVGMGTYKPEIYKYYKSHTKSETGLPGVEIKADKRGSIWNHWYIKYVLPLAVFAGIFGLWYALQFFQGKTQQKKQADETINPVVTPNAQVNYQSMQSEPKKPKESKRYRVVGTKKIEDLELIVMVQDAQNNQFINVQARECKFDLNGPECIIHEEIVNAYTGVRPSVVKKNKRHDLSEVVPTFGEASSS